MADKIGFHAGGGWFFERLGIGRVQISLDYALRIFDKDTWASIVASVSHDGENARSFVRASELHDGTAEDAPLQDALRALMAGRGDRDRLLLERWALALEGHLVDTSVIFEVDKEGKMHVGVTTEEGTVLEDSA
ncbi:hypothetical protein LCGC14_1244370 [marine sediment metagenome]|uniref:Uncharacterized protein n=1 Tax=marine sediment metagenome TaxID=412755 RepID=A0A0F9L8Q9_9ZZZZ